MEDSYGSNTHVMMRNNSGLMYIPLLIIVIKCLGLSLPNVLITFNYKSSINTDDFNGFTMIDELFLQLR